MQCSVMYVARVQCCHEGVRGALIVGVGRAWLVQCGVRGSGEGGGTWLTRGRGEA